MKGIDITRMSSRGQIVIPSSMRKDFKEGDEIVVIKDDERIILKKVSDFSKNIEEDLEFAKRTEEALKRYDRGEFISMNGDDFLKELEKW